MKLSTLTNPQFQTTFAKLANQDIPFRTSFALKGIIKRCNDELKKYDDVRMEAVQRLGNKKEDGTLDTQENGTVSLSEENAKTFSDELNTLLATEVNVGNVKIVDLGEKGSLTPNDFIVLDDIVVA